tara:strand:- start:5147 stop:5431 length:285 start_codon:yes stop_codon:yes gene_type:complete
MPENSKFPGSLIAELADSAISPFTPSACDGFVIPIPTRLFVELTKKVSVSTAKLPLIDSAPLRVVFPLRTGMIPTVFAVTFVPAERIDALIDID